MRTESPEDLTLTLERIADRWQQRAGIPVRFRSATLATALISGEAALQVTRIAEEAIANAVKHSHTPQIDLTLTYANNLWQLTVQDTGIGFTPGSLTTTGIGIATLHERAALLPRGAIEIFSTPTTGTTVRLHFAPQE